MADEFDTPAEAGTEDVQTPEHDNSTEDWDFYDPEEDTEEAQETEETDDGEGGDEDTPEDVDPEDDAEDQPDEAPQEAAEDAVVKLPDGEETTVGELIRGQLRQADYSRKTAEVAEQRRSVEAQAQRIAQINERLIAGLESLIPPPPDPALAYSDARQFQERQARHDAALKQLEQFVSVQDDAKSAQQQMTQEQRQRLVQDEMAQLQMRFPSEMGDPAKRKAFFESAAMLAQEIGFSEQEIRGNNDHRIFTLAHYARLGMEAEKAKASAKAKVSAAPKVPAKKPGGKKPNRNRDAMKRLSQSGSFEDALQIDFD